MQMYKENTHMERKLRNYTNKELNECSDLELFNALLNYTADEPVKLYSR